MPYIMGYLGDMSNVFLRYALAMSQIFKRYVWDMPEVMLEFASDMLRCTSDLPKIYIKIMLEYAWDMN